MIPPLFDYGDVGILVLRFGVAAMFLAHGSGKLKGKTPPFMLFIGIAETAGALALFAGFLTQLAAIGLGIIMLGAIYKKVFEWKSPYTHNEKMGWEVDVVLLSACIALATLGSGLYGVDAMYYY